MRLPGWRAFGRRLLRRIRAGERLFFSLPAQPKTPQILLLPSPTTAPPVTLPTLSTHHPLYTLFFSFRPPDGRQPKMAPKNDPNAITYLYMRVTGGEVGAPSALAPKVGPLGLSPKKIGEDIAANTGEWVGTSSSALFYFFYFFYCYVFIFGYVGIAPPAWSFLSSPHPPPLLCF